MKTTDDVVSLSFDRFPSPKGAATHIDAFARALGREFGNVRLVTVPPIELEASTQVEAWTANGVTLCPLPAEGATMFERVLAWRARIWNWWKHEFASRGMRPRVAHIRSIFEGYPIARNKADYCQHLVYEVNGLPSIELKYHYPAVADDRELLRKLQTQEQVCLEAADRIITVSHVNRRHLESRGVSPDRITVIPNGVNLEMFPWSLPQLAADNRTAVASANQDELKMLYVGTLSPWQGILHAIDALARYRRDAPARLTIAGPVRNHERKAIEKHAWRNGVSEFLDISGPVAKPDLTALYHAADVVVAPLTRNDRNCGQGCCPLKVLESLACGTPLIASNLEVVRELCRNEKHALLVKAGSGKAIKDAMHRLRQDAALAERLSRAGRSHVETQYPWSTAQRSLIEVYRAVMS